MFYAFNDLLHCNLQNNSWARVFFFFGSMLLRFYQEILASHMVQYIESISLSSYSHILTYSSVTIYLCNFICIFKVFTNLLGAFDISIPFSVSDASAIFIFYLQAVQYVSSAVSSCSVTFSHQLKGNERQENGDRWQSEI